MRFGGTLLILALLLAGCSGDPKPKEPDETTKPTPTSTATPPEMPAQAKEDSPEGAAALVIYWIKLLNFAATTGDSSELTEVSSPTCSGCSNYVRTLSAPVTSGERPKVDFWETTRVEVGDGRSPVVVVVDAKVIEGSGRADYQFMFTLSEKAPFRVNEVNVVGGS